MILHTFGRLSVKVILSEYLKRIFVEMKIGINFLLVSTEMAGIITTNDNHFHLLLQNFTYLSIQFQLVS